MNDLLSIVLTIVIAAAFSTLIMAAINRSDDKEDNE